MIFSLKRFVRNSPHLYFRVASFLNRNDGGIIRPNTDLLIEGFPRSANTYLLYCILFANQEKKLRIAGHLHSAAQIIRAEQYAIPTCIPIRNPQDTIRSQVVFNKGNVSTKSIILDYISFYRAFLPASAACVIADFDEIVEDTGGVIRRINQKYGTNLTPYIKTPENEALVKRALIKRNGIRGREKLHIPDQKKQSLKKAVDLSQVQTLLKKAESLYQQAKNIA